MAKLAQFPINQKSNKPKKKSLSTYDRRMQDMQKLNGKHNGWWVYQYVVSEYGEATKNRKKKKKGMLWG
mgnify:CR=1 FL=1